MTGSRAVKWIFVAAAIGTAAAGELQAGEETSADRPDWVRLPELRAYAEGRPYEEVATTLLSVLAYFPQSKVREDEAIADNGYKLGDDIYVIPLGDRVSGRDRTTIKLSGCWHADRTMTDLKRAALFLSVGDGSERVCVVVPTTVHETIQFLELLREVKLNGCFRDLRFSQAVFDRLDDEARAINGTSTDNLHKLVSKTLHSTC